MPCSIPGFGDFWERVLSWGFTLLTLACHQALSARYFIHFRAARVAMEAISGTSVVHPVEEGSDGSSFFV